MVNITERVSSVIGIDALARQRAIENIKQRILKDKSRTLNTVIFYPKEINLKDLQEKIITYSFDKDKLIIFKNACRLSADVKKFLFESFKKIVASNYLVFEIERDYFSLVRDSKISSDKFFQLILKKGRVLRISSYGRKVSIEDFKRSVRRNDLSSSLYVLEKLFVDVGRSREKEYATFLLGVLLTEVSFRRRDSQKEKNLNLLWETDRALKEKGIDSRLALEVLLAKLIAI
ncbi:MAG: hypothetical protein JSW17_03280 [Candidatus Omnitrophota bacterium]|nr:MAG: hypothetical protein JSW17_03280 [Candidatus Omnitrophota bacterium]